MNTKALSFICAPALVAFVGCASDVTFTSGVDGAKKVSDVTPDEAQTICDNAEATAREFVEDSKAGFCALAGGVAGVFGGGEAACEVARASCESQEPEITENTCNADVMAPDCEATIAELEACYNDSLESLQTVFDELGGKSCAELIADSGSGDALGNVGTPASCTALASKCPGLDIGVPATGTSTAS